MAERHEMEMYSGDQHGSTRYVSVFFGGIGNMTITFETREFATEARPVISIDFPVDKVDVIDAGGNDRNIEPR